MQTRFSWSPAEFSLDFFGAGHEYRRVTGPPQADANWNLHPSHLAGRINDLQDRKPAAGPEVKDSAGVLGPVQRQYVCARKIAHMNVIADTGAVRRRIVIAEDFHVRPLLGSRLQDVGNQMCFRIVLFAAAFRRAGGVEIAETHVAQTVGLLVPVAGALKGELGFAVRVCGTRGFSFIDDRLL